LVGLTIDFTSHGFTTRHEAIAIKA